MFKRKRIISIMILIALSATLWDTTYFTSTSTANAASTYTVSTNYPVQQMNIATKGNEKLLQYDTTQAITVATDSSSDRQSWQFVYITKNTFKLKNMYNGKLLHANGSSLTLEKDTDSKSSYWVITGLETDVLGNYLTYKITCYSNQTVALTFSSKSVSLSTYSGKDSQKWLLNSDGLQGFAGYSLDMDEEEKASTIGGVFGQTVFVDNVEDLASYAAGDTARTIVITKDLTVDVPANYQGLDSDEKLLTKIKVGKNKTLIGYYGVTLTNIYFYLDNSSNSGNFIMKNITLAHDEELNLNNFIPLYISVGENFWIDHVTFEGHDSYSSENGTVQEVHQALIDADEHPVDKFVYVGVKADYVTISDSKFENHEYGLILGYPNENSEEIMDTYTGYPRMTLSGNYFTRMYCRAPGLMRYGNYHTLNNYVEDAHLAYTLYTRATVYSESNYFSGVKGILDDKLCAGFTDVGSYPTVTAKVSPAATWSPDENYSYISLTAAQAKEFCTTYSGAQDNYKNFTYVEDLVKSAEVADTAASTPVQEDSSSDTTESDDNTSDSTEEDTTDSSEEVLAPVVHSFTQSGLTSDFFTIKGSLSSSKGTVSYSDMSLTQCLKLESSTSVTFTTETSSSLTLVFNSSFSGYVLIDGTKYKATNGIVTVTLDSGSHTIKKSDTSNLYYMQITY